MNWKPSLTTTLEIRRKTLLWRLHKWKKFHNHFLDSRLKFSSPYDSVFTTRKKNKNKNKNKRTSTCIWSIYVFPKLRIFLLWGGGGWFSRNRTTLRGKNTSHWNNARTWQCHVSVSVVSVSIYLEMYHTCFSRF